MSTSLEERIRTIEDRLEINNLLASHPLSADTGDRSIIESIYTEDVVFDRGANLPGARGKDDMAAFVQSDAHRAAIAGGLAHIGTPPYVKVDGDTAVAISYIAITTPDHQGELRELANHGTSTGFRIHRILANRWLLQRTEHGWAIAARKVVPMDGQNQAVELIRDVRSADTQR